MRLILLEVCGVDWYGAWGVQFCLKAPRGGLQNDVLLRQLDEVGYVAPTVVVDYEVRLCRRQNFSIIE